MTNTILYIWKSVVLLVEYSYNNKASNNYEEKSWTNSPFLTMYKDPYGVDQISVFAPEIFPLLASNHQIQSKLLWDRKYLVQHRQCNEFFKTWNQSNLASAWETGAKQRLNCDHGHLAFWFPSVQVQEWNRIFHGDLETSKLKKTFQLEDFKIQDIEQISE